MSGENEKLEDLGEAAEREVRRGNFKAALSLYETLLLEEPDNVALREKMKGLAELLQPMELVHPKAFTEPASSDVSRLHEAEAAVNRGDISNAIDEYRALLNETPENVLLKERLGELERLAEDPVMLATMPRSQAPSRPDEPEYEPSWDPAVPTRSKSLLDDKASDSEKTAAHSSARDLGLPQDPLARLEELLERVRRHRRA